MQVPRPKDIHAVSGEILRLEKELAFARAKYNALFGVTEPEKRIRTATLDGFTEKVLECVDLHFDEELTISRAAQLLGEPELPTGKALYRLAKAGKISNPRRGRYRAIEKEASPEEKSS